MDKRKLYEKIMTDISKVVKRRIKEYAVRLPDDIISQTEDAIDRYVIDYGQKAMKIISELNPEERMRFMQLDVYEAAWFYAFSRYGKTALNEVKSPSIVFDAKNTAEELKNYFDLDDFQVEVNDQFKLNLPNIIIKKEEQFHQNIMVVIPKLERNLNEIREFMRLHGYTLIRRYVPYAEDFRQIYVLFFTPIERIDVAKDFQDVQQKLYHVTGKEYRKSIKEKGLIPKARYGLFNQEDGIEYPERVFLFTDKDYAEEMRANAKQRGYDCDIYAFNVSDIARRFPMFYDPLYGKIAIYVEKTISPELIEEIY